MTLSPAEDKLLYDYADVFNINPSTFISNKDGAYVILAMLYGYLSLDKDERRRYRDGVLVETDNQFGQDSAFFGQIQGAIALLIAQPAWFNTLATNSDLIRQFKNLLIGVTVLSLIGISPVGGPIRKGVEDTVKRGTLRAGLEAAKKRLLLGAGSGVIEAIVTRIGIRFPIGAAAVALMAIAYIAMIYKMEKIRSEMLSRYEVGLATEEELDAIGNDGFMDVINERLEGYW